MPKYLVNPLDRVFNALSDATRRDVVERLARDGEQTVSGLAEPYAMALPSFTQHLDVLEQASLIASTKVGRQRHVTLNAEAIAPARAWLDGIAIGTHAVPAPHEPAAAVDAPAVLAKAQALARDLAPVLAVVAVAVAPDGPPEGSTVSFSPIAHAGRRLARVLHGAPGLAADLRSALALYQELTAELAAARPDGDVEAVMRASLPLGRHVFTWRSHPLLREVVEEALELGQIA